MNISELRTQVRELRWLAYELGQELDTLAITPYPHVHRFLMHNLSTHLIQVAQRTCESLTHPAPTPVACPDVQPIEQSA